MSLETQELPPSVSTRTPVRRIRRWIERGILAGVIMLAIGLMLGWFAFLAWALYWLLSGLV
ncbi:MULTISPECIES: hypothetical protein [unclassified Aureimonas]|uniref:hypothetical protein n=1 Tax=unclassified Aureimonas TaxID=2615206 RepID=UPI000700BD23|nr:MULTISPECIES: hypothetical protein [unclassified Aureimonas]KQT79425.1 hypothetical protein ASG54_10470 [Aureimonas sp. Leaf460]